MESNLAQSLLKQGKYAEAEANSQAMLRKLRDVEFRVLGAKHPGALITAGDLAASLHYQDKYADAERIQREVLEAKRRILAPGRSIRKR